MSSAQHQCRFRVPYPGAVPGTKTHIRPACCVSSFFNQTSLFCILFTFLLLVPPSLWINIGLRVPPPSLWIYIGQVITLEGWTDIMYHIQDVHSFWNWAYFVVLIVVSIKQTLITGFSSGPSLRRWLFRLLESSWLFFLSPSWSQLFPKEHINLAFLGGPCFVTHLFIQL